VIAARRERRGLPMHAAVAPKRPLILSSACARPADCRTFGDGSKRWRTLPRPTFARLHKRLIPLFAPCFSLLSLFFSLFRGSSGLENPQKTVCFQLVGQKSPSRAEQEANREIIRGYQGGSREITGAEQAGRDSTGSSAVRRHSVTIEPLEMWRLNPTLLDRRTASGRIRRWGDRTSEAERRGRWKTR
jgi:hypothetical protein